MQEQMITWNKQTNNKSEKIRLGVDKGNPQSHAFWTKNRFQTIGEARYIVMEREI